MKIQNTIVSLSLIILGGSLFGAGQETLKVREPRALEIVEPAVPVNYLRWGIPGHVLIEFKIDAEGCPQNIELVSYDDRRYAKSVKEAVRQWRFEQPEIAGLTYRLPVNFSRG